MSDYVIAAEQVRRSFRSGRNEIDALQGVTASVPRRCFAVLQGPSGSGKTTLMNILSGLDRPTSGNVFFEGVRTGDLSERELDNLRRMKMGFVFQSVALLARMTALENVEFILRVAGDPPKGRITRAEECLHLVGLGKRMQHLPHELSGGEQQRVAIARAIAHRPTVLFADEPTAELDSHRALQIVQLFRALVEQEGITVIMTTHDPELQELADLAIPLVDGKIAGNNNDSSSAESPSEGSPSAGSPSAGSPSAGSPSAGSGQEPAT